MLARRGRPPVDTSTTDKIIAYTVDRLIMWGFSGRGEVFEVVGIAARTVLGRIFDDGTTNTALGAERIEQIWEQYRPRGWERYWPDEMRQRMKQPPRRNRYTKKGLQSFVPDPTANVHQLAETLLKNGGNWPCPTEQVWCPFEQKWEEQEISVFRGDPELTLKWASVLMPMSPIRKRKK